MSKQASFNFGHFIPISTVDWYGRSAAVLFLRGCQFRCPYCQNYPYLTGSELMSMEDIQARITKASRFVSALVFSGGEPTLQPEAIKTLARYAASLSLAVGLETNGFGMDIVSDMLDEGILDKVFMDIKAPVDDPVLYGKVIGLDEKKGAEAAKNAVLTLNKCLDADIEVEIRTTVFRGLIGKDEISRIGQYLEKYPQVSYAIQQGVPENTLNLKHIEIFSRDELLEMVKAIDTKHLRQIRICTIDNGNERI
ncbi:MAG: anaerobic ribonucleoside-triphosphate reductase activating protein [Methanosarcinales archaeon]|nr:anaerobic ribonucleoside-triphosphate reductase activating protein [Methanosarcinales archaeon]